MFNKADVEAYRSIQAPSRLREKVMMEQKIKSFPYPKACVAAACCVAVMGLTSVSNWNQSYVTIQGEMASTATVASLDSRNISHSSISVKLDSNHKRKVAVSEGSLQYVDPKTGETVKVDSKLWVNANAELIWVLDPQVEQSYELSVTGWGKDETFLLTYDQVDEHWQISKER